MHIRHFRINNFRNITTSDITFHPHINLIEGLNGSGKTSLLEALYFISHGRSFKANQLNRIIQHDCAETTLFAEITHTKMQKTLALQKNKNGQTELRLNHISVNTQSELTRSLPIQLLHPGSFAILTSGAKYRCQLLDWGAFYSQNKFHLLWRKAKQLIRQRNSLLKQNPSQSMLKPWDYELAICGSELNELRFSYMNKFQKEINQLLPTFSQQPVKFDYYRGWSNQEELADTLQKYLAQDIKSGFTHYGPHRADLRITTNHLPASDVLSRGQQKLLILALKLAQGALFYQEHQTPCIYLIDDLLSELDENATNTVLEFLKNQKAQIFISAINTKYIANTLSNDEYHQFTLNNGKITAN
ncbi:DNA replication/repair protein RecF [Thiotrichales bacterium 19S3-7]|nr:DNA replication/repair protein RecF [Thiotrichales bacterium 19S3-7]MCF6802040.1 DNA replication/repair protein RecF [Thiotrichales bacterium 19S3-11]